MAGYTRILVPVDFSDSSTYATGYAAEFARAFGARLDVVHVCTLHEEAVAEAEGRLSDTMPDGVDDVVESRRVVRAISAELGIIHEARESGADLVILGTHGRGGLKHVLLGSVAERVVQLAGCPVLTVRRPGHGFERP